MGTECKVKCADEETDCYLLDNNGFVIVSEKFPQTGKFFGEIDDDLLQTLVKKQVYQKVRMFDYQAICVEVYEVSGPGASLLTPFTAMKRGFLWIWAKLSLFMVDMMINGWSSPSVSASDYEYENYDYRPSEPEENKKGVNKTKPKPCDKEFDLYQMLPTSGDDEPITGKYLKCASMGCEQHYIAQHVPHTNLLMVVVLNTCPCEGTSRRLDSDFMDSEIDCQMRRREKYRQKPDTCINQHPEEEEIKLCGKGWLSVPSPFVTMLTISITLFHVIFLRPL